MAASGRNRAPPRLEVRGRIRALPRGRSIRRCRPHITQQLSNLVYRLNDGDVGPGGFELTFELDECDIRGVKTAGEKGRDVKCRRRIACKQSPCVGDIELRTFEGSDISGMGPIQQNRQLAEYRSRFRNPRKRPAFFDNLHQAFSKKQQLPGSLAVDDHHLARFISRDGQARQTLLDRRDVRNKRLPGVTFERRRRRVIRPGSRRHDRLHTSSNAVSGAVISGLAMAADFFRPWDEQTNSSAWLRAVQAYGHCWPSATQRGSRAGAHTYLPLTPTCAVAWPSAAVCIPSGFRGNQTAPQRRGVQ